MIRISFRRRCVHGRAISGVGWVSLFLLAGCASMPEPLAFAAAEQSIASAERTQIAAAAAPELNEAWQKLLAARAAARNRRSVEAERLALESWADANLAIAKSAASKARAINDELRRSTDMLTHQMQRQPGGKQ